MNHLDLFSGIGGFALAARWAGMTTVQFCEIDPFCQKVLAKNFPGVPLYDDIRTLPADALGRVDLVTGGFPCQPVSLAGKRRGAADDRWLWPEMVRVVAAARPRWVVGENTPGLIGMGLDGCLADLEGLGYEARTVVLPACAVGAPHRRDRVWIVAHAERMQGGERNGVDVLRRWQGDTEQVGLGGGGQPLADAANGGLRRGGASWQAGLPAFGGEDAADAEDHLRRASGDDRSVAPDGRGDAPANADSERGEARRAVCLSVSEKDSDTECDSRRQTLSCLGVSDDGLSRRLAGLIDPRWQGDPLNAFGPHWEDGVPRTTAHEDQRAAKLKALGNAIVPQVAYVILAEIAAMEAA